MVFIKKKVAYDEYIISAKRNTQNFLPKQLDQVWSILNALDLLPFDWSLRGHLKGSNSNAGKMDQTWST